METEDSVKRESIKQEANGDEQSESEEVVTPLLVAMQPNEGEETQETVEPIEIVVLSGAHDDINTVEIQSTGDIGGGSVVDLGAVEEVVEEYADSSPAPNRSFMPGVRIKREKTGRSSKYTKQEWILPSTPVHHHQTHHHQVHHHQASAEKESSSEESSSEDSSSNEDGDNIPSHIAARRLPKKREFAHRLQWRNKDMGEALKSVQDNKLSIRGASRKYKVPYSTLKDRVHGRVRHGTKPGVKTALSPEEENDLVIYVQELEQAGFQFRCVDVRVRAAEILRLNYGHNSPYKDTSPGHNWLSGFLKRHPGLEFKKSMTRNIIPSVPKQKMMIRRFYDTITYFYKKNKVTGRAERIFTVSEMRVPIYNEATVLYSASADGTIMPPFVVFTGPAKKHNLNVARQAYPDASFTCTIEGQITEDVFLWWFRDHFLPKIAHVHKPVVLLISRPVNDLSFQLVQLAKEERVFLMAIPNLVSHLLQPLDAAFSSEVETQIMRRVMKWEGENPKVPCTHKVLAQILQKVWKKTICGVDVRSKFKEKGIYPVNSSVITTEQIQYATQKLKEEPQQRSPGSTRASSANTSSGLFQGLNLLSALSSHEYASLDNTPEKDHTDDVDYIEPDEEGAHRGDGEQERIILRVSRKRKKKNRIDSTFDTITRAPEHLEEREIDTSMERDHEQDNSHHETMSLLERNLRMKMDETPVPRRRSRKGVSVEPVIDVKQEVLAAKDNREQINRAVESILGSSASMQLVEVDESELQQQFPSPHSKRHRTRSTSHGIHPIQITPVVSSYENVIEEVVQDDPMDDNHETHDMHNHHMIVNMAGDVVTEIVPIDHVEHVTVGEDYEVEADHDQGEQMIEMHPADTFIQEESVIEETVSQPMIIDLPMETVASNEIVTTTHTIVSTPTPTATVIKASPDPKPHVIKIPTQSGSNPLRGTIEIIKDQYGNKIIVFKANKSKKVQPTIVQATPTEHIIQEVIEEEIIQ